MASFPIRQILVVGACVIAGVLLGWLVGILLGLVAPDFAYALFGSVRQPEDPTQRMDAPILNARQLSTGLGIANGVWVGLVAGIAIVIGEAIKSLKKG